VLESQLVEDKPVKLREREELPVWTPPASKKQKLKDDAPWITITHKGAQVEVQEAGTMTDKRINKTFNRYRKRDGRFIYQDPNKKQLDPAIEQRVLASVTDEELDMHKEAVAKKPEGEWITVTHKGQELRVQPAGTMTDKRIGRTYNRYRKEDGKFIYIDQKKSS
jgi:hypothetical protein